MPPADKPLPPSVLAALGLAACSGTATACLKVTSDTTYYGPCLDYAVDTADADTDTDTDTDADTDTDTDADTDTGSTTGHTGGSGTVGPCLSPTYDSGGSGGTGGSGTTTPTAPSRAALFERIEAEGVLPADILERLRRRTD